MRKLKWSLLFQGRVGRVKQSRLTFNPRPIQKMNVTVRIPNDIADFFGVPEFVTREEFAKFFPAVAVPADGGSADWSAYADIFRAYEDHRVVVSVSANRLALVLSRYSDEQARIHCAQPVRQIVVEQ